MANQGTSLGTAVAILSLAAVVVAGLVAWLSLNQSSLGGGRDGPPVGQPLHANPHLACSGCEAVVSMLTQALQFPNPQLLGQKVQEVSDDGRRMREVEYVTSAAYVHALLDIVCSSSSLAQLSLKRNWVGVPGYGADPVPSYHRRSSNRGDPSLKQACEALTANEQRALLVPALKRWAPEHPPEAVVALACSRALRACAHKETARAMLTAVLEEVLVREPIVVLRLLPLLVMFVLLLAVLSPPNWTPADPSKHVPVEDVAGETASVAPPRGGAPSRRKKHL